MVKLVGKGERGRLTHTHTHTHIERQIHPPTVNYEEEELSERAERVMEDVSE